MRSDFVPRLLWLAFPPSTGGSGRLSRSSIRWASSACLGRCDHRRDGMILASVLESSIARPIVTAILYRLVVVFSNLGPSRCGDWSAACNCRVWVSGRKCGGAVLAMRWCHCPHSSCHVAGLRSRSGLPPRGIASSPPRSRRHAVSCGILLRGLEWAFL